MAARAGMGVAPMHAMVPLAEGEPHARPDHGAQSRGGKDRQPASTPGSLDGTTHVRAPDHGHDALPLHDLRVAERRDCLGLA
eukprot:2267757-Heterocapsa_arctica.AAC.1